MGMTIEEAIKKLSQSAVVIGCEDWMEARDLALETMRKYQQLEKQVKQLENRCHALTHGVMCGFCSYECEHKVKS